MSKKKTMLKRILAASLCTLMSVPVAGASLSVSAANAENAPASAVANAETTLKNTSDIEWNGIYLGESVEITCSAKGGQGTKQFAVYYKEDGQTNWKTISAYSTKKTVKFTPEKSGGYTIRVKAKDENGKTAAKDFDLWVDELVNADFLKKHKVGITGSFCNWGHGIDYDEFVPDVEMNDDDGDGIWEGVVNIDEVTDEMVRELTTEDEYANTVFTGIYGIQCKIRLDDQWNYFWADYESIYERTENSQTNLCIPATVGEPLSFRVFLDTNQIMSPYYELTDNDAYCVWKTGFETIENTIDNTKLKNTSDIEQNWIYLGESVEITCSAKGGQGTKQFAVYYKEGGQTNWKTISAYSTKETVKFTPAKSGVYTIRVKAKDENGKTTAKDFDLCVNELVNADFLRKHKVGITGSFCNWGYGINFDEFEYIPDVEMKDDDGDGIWEGVVNIDKVTDDMIQELTPWDEEGNRVSTGIYGIQCKIRLDDQWNYNWADYESIYERTENSQTNLCIPATVGEPLSFRVFLDTNQVMNPDYDLTDNEAYNVWKTGVEVILKNTSSLSAKSIVLGTSTKIKLNSVGGNGETKYKVLYQKKGAANWKTISDYTDKTAVNFKPAAAGTYTIRVKAKDESNNIKVKDMTLVVYKPLKNTTAVDAVTIKLGDKVNVLCQAEDGKGDYKFAVYYKKSTSSTWTKARGFSADTLVSIAPKAAVNYDIRVDAKDKTGTIVSSSFSLTVKK